jgi:HK97 family phage major capsid protein
MLTKALIEKRANLTAEAEALCEQEATRDLTAEEEARFEAISAELKTLDKKVTRASEIETRSAQLAAPVAQAQARLVHPGTSLSPEAAAGPQPKTEFENLGEMMFAVARRPNDSRLASLWAATDQSTTDARGGYAIPPRFLENTLLQVGSAPSIVRPRATVLPGGSGNPDQTLQIPALDQSDHGESPSVPKTFGGVAVSWISEGAEKPQTDFKLREVTLTPYEVAASLDVNDRLLANWAACGSLVQSLFTGAMNAAEDQAFLTGNGSSKPTGFIGHASTVTVSRQSAGSFTYNDATGMISSMLMRGGSPIWILSQSVMPKLLQMQDPNGNYVWQPNAREGVPSTLLGYPIEWSERVPLLGTAGDVSLVDLSKYLILDGSGPFIGASEHVRWRENKTVFKCYKLIDGKPWLTQPFMGEDGLTYSPFVTLS